MGKIRIRDKNNDRRCLNRPAWTQNNLKAYESRNEREQHRPDGKEKKS